MNADIARLATLRSMVANEGLKLGAVSSVRKETTKCFIETIEKAMRAFYACGCCSVQDIKDIIGYEEAKRILRKEKRKFPSGAVKAMHACIDLDTITESYEFIRGGENTYLMLAQHEKFEHLCAMASDLADLMEDIALDFETEEELR